MVIMKSFNHGSNIIILAGFLTNTVYNYIFFFSGF